jgi:hypothetical protein
MNDRVLLSLLAALAVVLIGFAAIWPQGQGARSPGPFGHIPTQQTPEMKAAMAREAAEDAARKHGGAAVNAGLRTLP